MTPITITKNDSSYQITPRWATPDDYHSVWNLLLQKAKAFKESGSSQWSALLDGVDSHNTKYRITNNEVMVYEYNSQIIGAVILLHEQSTWDTKLWGKDKAKVFYIHRLMVSNEFNGMNLGSHMLKHIEEIAESLSISSLRLDYLNSNKFLKQFYTINGFTVKKKASRIYYNAKSSFSQLILRETAFLLFTICY
ncbi:GNAT family acetyltransferase [Brochothrix thermosphacta DSM 20171 = FSL F6-1036]|nr:GNAT family acetyltransferase [Brochothrix thermosphacta DSM 20171 = FSL F6-1036]